MKAVTIDKIISGQPLGSSRPVIAETSDGLSFVKLRGAAQGTGPLVAEVIANNLAQLLSLPVLPMSLVVLNDNVPCEDTDQELADLIAASIGINVAYPYLKMGRDAHLSHLDLLSDCEKAGIFLLDQFLLNPDRMTTNPNLFYHAGKVYVVDFGSSLPFQYNWKNVTEQSPLYDSPCQERHVFSDVQRFEQWIEFQKMFVQSMTREKLEDALAMVPDCFIEPLLSKESKTECSNMVERRKSAYVAFLWKRVKSFHRFTL